MMCLNKMLNRQNAALTIANNVWRYNLVPKEGDAKGKDDAKAKDDGAKAKDDGKKGGAKPVKFDPGPIDGINLADQPDILADLPPIPDGPLEPAAPIKGDGLKAPPDLKPEKADLLPPLPERSLGLDL